MRGRGVASHAIRLFSQWSFSRLGMERLQALVHPDNPSSMRVLLRAGFQVEGLLRAYRAEPGGREDRVIFSLLAGEQGFTEADSERIEPRGEE